MWLFFRNRGSIKVALRTESHFQSCLELKFYISVEEVSFLKRVRFQSFHSARSVFSAPLKDLVVGRSKSTFMCQESFASEGFLESCPSLSRRERERKEENLLDRWRQQHKKLFLKLLEPTQLSEDRLDSTDRRRRRRTEEEEGFLSPKEEEQRKLLKTGGEMRSWMLSNWIVAFYFNSLPAAAA